MVQIYNIKLSGVTSAGFGPTARPIATPPSGSAAGVIGDLESYPILTEEVGYPPSPSSSPLATGSGGVPGGAPIGQMAYRAVSDVLGWKLKPGDPKGFLGALTQSFTLTD